MRGCRPNRDKGLWEYEREQFPYRCYGGLPRKILKPPAMNLYQIRILLAIYRANRPITAIELSHELNMDVTRIRRGIGSIFREKNWWRDRWEKDHIITLIDRGYVRVEHLRSKNCHFVLTPIGKLVAEKIQSHRLPEKTTVYSEKTQKRVCLPAKEYLDQNLIQLQQEIGEIGHPVVLALSGISSQWSEFSKDRYKLVRLEQQTEEEEFQKLGVNLQEMESSWTERLS